MPLRAARAEREKALLRLAEGLLAALPFVRAFLESVRGFGLLGLALIVGEAGDLAGYPNPAKLWKRMGLAVGEDGRAQRRVARNVERALAQGFAPERRAVMWTIGDSLLKGNRGGEWKQLYDTRKAREKEKLGVAADEADMHAHRRAQRYVEKRLLRELWAAWRRDRCRGETQAKADPAVASFTSDC